MFKFLEKPRMTAIIWAAAASACGAFVRPAAMFIPYCVIAFIIFFCTVKRVSAARIAAFAVVFSLISVTPIKLWEYRNLHVSDFKGFSAISAMSLYFYNAAGVLAKLENKSFDDMQNDLGYRDNEIYKARHTEQLGLSQGEVFNLMAKEGKEVIKSYPRIYAKLHLEGMLLTIISTGTNDLLQKILGGNTPGFRSMKQSGSMISFIAVLIKEMPMVFIYRVSSVILLIILYFIAVSSLPMCIRSRPFETMSLVLTAAYFILIAGPVGDSRFRQPFSFIIAIFAGIGIDRILACKNKKKRALSDYGG
jgi:hypothetical protein